MYALLGAGCMRSVPLRLECYALLFDTLRMKKPLPYFITPPFRARFAKIQVYIP
jgi:hypothetical protein